MAGCATIAHGTFLDNAILEPMAGRGVNFDPNFLGLHNYPDKEAEVSGHRQITPSRGSATWRKPCRWWQTSCAARGRRM
jgi:hypothetical protein